MDATLSRPLICSRFQTPRNVPGNTMKKSPVVTNAINRRDSASSRIRAISKSCAGESVGRSSPFEDPTVGIFGVAMRLHPRQTTAVSSSTARGKRMLFSRCTCRCRSFSN